MPGRAKKAVYDREEEELGMKSALLERGREIGRVSVPWDYALLGEWEGSPLFFREDPCPMWFFLFQGRTCKWISAGDEPGREAFLMIVLNLEKNSRLTDYVRRFVPRLKNDYADLRAIGRSFRLDNIFLFAETVACCREITLLSRKESLNAPFIKLLMETPSLAVNVTKMKMLSSQREKSAFSISA